jgi:N utilization substance protein A
MGGFADLKNDFLVAVTQMSAERHLTKEVVLETIEEALVLAYKRQFGAAQNVEVRIDPNTGRARVYVEKEVVDEVKDKRTEISLREARIVDAMAGLGSTVKIEMTPKNFGRIAVQTAKQVIQQRIREAERETLYADWSDRLGELVLGTVRNIDAAGNVILSLGRAEALMPRSEQIPTEQYSRGQKLRTYIYEVEKTSRGPRIRISRTHKKLLRRLLESEVPEIYNGTVEIKAIAREPGSRSKVAVAATQPGVDPVGSCVGMRGVRIQSVVNELNGEKIDVVAWAPDEKQSVANALSPARVEHVWLDPETKTATVVVPDNQLSLAIGKEGQNARLAAKLTKWRIDIKSLSEAAEEAERRAKEEAEAAEREAELAVKREAAKALLEQAERALAEEQETEAQPVAEEAAPAGDVEVQEEAPAVEEAEEAAPELEAAAEVPLSEEEGEGLASAEVAEVEEPAITVAGAEEAQPATVSVEAEEEALEAVEVSAEAPEEEQVPIEVSAEIAEEAVTWSDADEDEELDEEERDSERKRKKARRRHTYIYDEEAERVVRKPRRKSSRQQPDWEREADW